MNNYTFRTLSLIMILSILGCTESKFPEEEELYVFNLGSKVDAKYLGCGYEWYEGCGDRVKKRVRETVGYLSNEELVRIGNKIHTENIPFSITTHKRGKWVEEIVDKMREHLINDKFDYNAYVVSSSDFNAFTIPGGNIYVTTGVLDMVKNKDELAYIIGHELGHNENDHTKESAYLMRYNEVKDSEDSFFSTATSIATSLFANSCGKSDELECDISAIYLLYMAGYDPEKALGGVDILRKISTPKEGGWFESVLYAAFGSHPWSEDRARCVKGYVRGSKVHIKCEEKYEDQIGKVITRSSPLNIRKYPISKAEKLFPIPKGEEVTVICDCIEQEYRTKRDWLYVEYFDGTDFYKGWVDKKYIEFQ